MGNTQVLVKDRTYKRLTDLKSQYRSKSYNKIIDKLIDIHDHQFKNPKSIAIEELQTIFNKYHYVFNKEDFLILTEIPALLMGHTKTRINLLSRLLEDLGGQEQL